ncbi:hypothetical protein A2U01_0076723, partial [Trifolium medium]|nr:hypothetical protein [Trifolium medium]
STNWEVDWDMT